MEKKYKLGVIGAGFMSTAILKGAISSSIVKNSDVIVSDINEDSLAKIKEFGVEVTKDNELLCNQSEFVLFAIKPQNLTDVLEGIKYCSCNKFISIMAGIKKDRIKFVFPNCFVARCMPNTPCSIGKGAVGIDTTDFVDKNDVLFIETLFNSFASVVMVDETKMNAVTGVSGSSPAYFYLFLKGVIEAGVKQGLTEEDARTLATNTMIGAGEMVLNNKNKSIDELISAVCSKGGTTIEAVRVFNEHNLADITEKAIDACVKRSLELENV